MSASEWNQPQTKQQLNNQRQHSPPTPTRTETKDDDSDLCCGICLDLCFEPCHTKCNHIFCKTCLNKTRLYSTNNTFPCPLCRRPQQSSHTPTVNPTTAQQYNKQIARRYPEKMKEHLKDLQKLRVNGGSTCHYQVVYGNRHAIDNSRTRNKHIWTAFVDVVDEKGKKVKDLSRIISKVSYDFDVYFPHVVRRSLSSRSRSQFEVRRRGWGTFEIEIKIQFCSDLNLSDVVVRHELSFDQNVSKSASPFSMSVENQTKLKNQPTLLKQMSIAERRAKGNAARLNMTRREYLHF